MQDDEQTIKHTTIPPQSKEYIVCVAHVLFHSIPYWSPVASFRLPMRPQPHVLFLLCYPAMPSRPWFTADFVSSFATTTGYFFCPFKPSTISSSKNFRHGFPPYFVIGFRQVSAVSDNFHVIVFVFEFNYVGQKVLSFGQFINTYLFSTYMLLPVDIGVLLAYFSI